MPIWLFPSLAWSADSGFTFKKLITPNISSTSVDNSQSAQSDGEFFGDVLFNSNQLRNDIGDVDGNRFSLFASSADSLIFISYFMQFTDRSI